MVVIPRKWMPYVLAILGLGGAVLVAMSDAPDKVSGTIACVLCGIGGVVWAVIDIRNKKKSEE